MDKLFFLIFFSHNVDTVELTFFNSSDKEYHFLIGLDSNKLRLKQGRKYFRNTINYNNFLGPRFGKKNEFKTYERFDTLKVCPGSTIFRKYPTDSSFIYPHRLADIFFVRLIFVDQKGRKIKGLMATKNPPDCVPVPVPKRRSKR